MRKDDYNDTSQIICEREMINYIYLNVINETNICLIDKARTNVPHKL